MTDRIRLPLLSHLQFAILDIIERTANRYDEWCPAVRVSDNTGLRGPGFYQAMRRLVKMGCVEQSLRKLPVGDCPDVFVVRTYYRLMLWGETLLSETREFYEERKAALRQEG